MAQWIPKTAWRAASLNKSYGPQSIGLNLDVHSSEKSKSFFVSTAQPQRRFSFESANSKHYHEARVREKYLAGVPFLDLRGELEQKQDPLTLAAPLHVSDILSGACVHILPEDKQAEIFVIASNAQRAVNGFNALRRWGYHNVVTLDHHAIPHLNSDV